MGIRAAYTQKYTDNLLAVLQHDRDGLAAVGMDAGVYAPYPSGKLPKAAYRQAQGKYQRVRFSFQSVKSCRWPGEPEIVVERPEAEPKLRARAKQEADAVVDSYLTKLAGKIGKDIVSVKTNGNVWDYAELEAQCADGEQQRWHTRCILNFSVYHKPFNQWPTRRVA